MVEHRAVAITKAPSPSSMGGEDDIVTPFSDTLLQAIEEPSKWMRLSLLVVLLLISIPPLVNPPELAVRGNDLIFDPSEQEKPESGTTQVILQISSDDGGDIIGNLSRFKAMVSLAEQVEDEDSVISIASLKSESTILSKLTTPSLLIAESLTSQGIDWQSAVSWAQIIENNPNSSCSEDSKPTDEAALAGLLLLTPTDATPGYLCPELPGGNKVQPPMADKVLWQLNFKLHPTEGLGIKSIEEWVSELNTITEFKFEATGTRFLLAEARVVAIEDIQELLPLMGVAVLFVLWLTLRDIKTIAVVIGGLILTLLALGGTLMLLGHRFTLIDLVALPLLLGIGVDGVAWHRRGEVGLNSTRGLLLVAAVTTIATMLTTLNSPIPALRSLVLTVGVGIFLSWLITRFLLEPFLVITDESNPQVTTTKVGEFRSPFKPMFMLAVLFTLLLVPPLLKDDSEPRMEFSQLLPDDSPHLSFAEELESEFLLASTSQASVIVKSSGADLNTPEALNHLTKYGKALSSANEVVKVDLVSHQVPLLTSPSTVIEDCIRREPDLVPGLSHDGIEFKHTEQTPSIVEMMDLIRVCDTESMSISELVIVDEKSDDIKGFVLMLMIDSRSIEGANQAYEDFSEVQWPSGEVEVIIGGNVLSMGRVAKEMNSSLAESILGGATALFIIGIVTLRKFTSAGILAIGGLVIAGVVDLMVLQSEGGRGFMSTPAILLSMGVGADYLAHALHLPKGTGMFGDKARWTAATTSCAAFGVMLLADFPPLKQFSLLLLVATLFSALLATFLVRAMPYYGGDGEEE